MIQFARPRSRRFIARPTAAAATLAEEGFVTQPVASVP
ncbi:hypothetical protein PAMC26510_12165 [Caballeronia sordidicola]|uniref:Uncharacterized protein n=1 Tax=Caballeronia sordidicola TaxID=196367 RepID=A0A242MY64_CABSO|nr:hypothetical protein PAMC26510_12165 [Caballeronia sordidicola]